ncbi:MAG: hypothetical protein ABIJ09_12645 [Pseudomonadota bacterium]
MAAILGLSPGLEAAPCAGLDDEICAAQEARALIEVGEARAAIQQLKPALQGHPGSRPLTLWLSRAYLDDGNAFWAWRTLDTFLGQQPGDCEIGQWQAYALLQQAAVDDAEVQLASLGCPASGALATRRWLLQALMARHRGATVQVRAALSRARAGDTAFAEDRQAIARLSAQLDPVYEVPIRGRLVAGMGWTSNALAGSPADPADTDRSRRSALGDLDLSLRLRSPWGGVVRPRLDLDARALAYPAEAAVRDLSQLGLGLGPSLLFGSTQHAALLRYRFDVLALAGGDRYAAGPLVFSNAHRLEFEVAPSTSLFAFGGGGRRLYREQGRSRFEVDAGVASSQRAGSWLSVSSALTGRVHDADRAAYDLVGTSSLISFEARLPWELGLRLGALGGLDSYPASRDAFTQGASRHDLLTRFSISGLSPSWNGLRGVLSYEFARRDSTAPRYDFVDHRVLGRLSWAFEYDPLLPVAVDPTGHVPLGLDTGRSQDSSRDRVQEMLRQDEAMQRGSSCVE